MCSECALKVEKGMDYRITKSRNFIRMSRRIKTKAKTIGLTCDKIHHFRVEWHYNALYDQNDFQRTKPAKCQLLQLPIMFWNKPFMALKWMTQMQGTLYEYFTPNYSIKCQWHNPMEHFSALCNGVWHYETTKELGIDALNVCEVNNMIKREQ